FAHWRYLLDHTFGPVTAVQCTGATHIPERRDEQGRRYAATADDAAYATFALDGPTGEILAQFNSSWAVRVYRDDLLQIQVDGTAIPQRFLRGREGRAACGAGAPFVARAAVDRRADPPPLPPSPRGGEGERRATSPLSTTWGGGWGVRHAPDHSASVRRRQH